MNKTSITSDFHQTSPDQSVIESAITFLIALDLDKPHSYASGWYVGFASSYYGIQLDLYKSIYDNCIALMKLTDEYKDSVERNAKVSSESGKTPFSGILLTEIQRLTQNLNETNNLLRSLLEK